MAISDEWEIHLYAQTAHRVSISFGHSGLGWSDLTGRPAGSLAVQGKQSSVLHLWRVCRSDPLWLLAVFVEWFPYLLPATVLHAQAYGKQPAFASKLRSVPMSVSSALSAPARWLQRVGQPVSRRVQNFLSFLSSGSARLRCL